jgi:hypothetical protein
MRVVLGLGVRQGAHAVSLIDARLHPRAASPWPGRPGSIEDLVMRHIVVIGALGAALALAGASAAAGPQAPAEHPRIDGAWTLNREMGDQMRGGSPGPGDGGERRGSGGGGGHRGGFGMGGGGMGGMGGGMRPMGGSMPDREEMQRRRLLMHELLAPPTRLTITTDRDVVAFTDEVGRVRKYEANGKKEKHQFDNGTVKTKAKWDGDHLAIETSLDDGVKLTQTYALAGDRRQLIVQTTVEGGMSRDSGDRRPLTHYYDDVAASQ